MKTIMHSMLALVSIVALCYGAALAGDVIIQNEFQSGSPAIAADVNTNFQDVAVEVNDNNARINANTSDINGIYTELDSMSGVAYLQQSGSFSLTTSYANIMTMTINAPSAGYVFITATGMIQLSGKTNGSSAEYSSVYVGMSDVSNSSPNSSIRFYLSGIGPSGSYEVPYSVQNVFPVSAGSNTFYLVGIENGGSGSANIWFSQLTGIFIRNGL